uniref:Solute carrier family 5 member 6 n=1 Tax=Macrostomum lignano TaxID=282301 RepID=A0A1I8ISX3_9PLAT
MTWPLVGLSLYMSNIGSSSFMGVAGSAAAKGVAVLCYEFCGLFGIILLGYAFIPVYVSSGAFTMPEYLRRRFGGSRLQMYLAVQNLILFVFTKLSGELYGGVLILQQALLIDNKYLALLGLLAVTTLYTILGGLSAVIYTDALQGVIVVIGAFILTGFSLNAVGSYENMENLYFRSIANETLLGNSTCGLADPDAFKMMRPITDPEYPWLGISLGAFILSGWYFCTDQVLVQRILAAKDLTHAKAGTAMAAILKILPLFIMIWRRHGGENSLPGFPVAAAMPPTFTWCWRVMPTIVKGLMVSALLAALMSSLTSIFNSAATLFTVDIWLKFRPHANNKEQMLVSRVFTLGFLLIGIAWLPTVDLAEGGQIFHYLQQINSFLAPPLFACFLMAVMWTRMNEEGAFWAWPSGWWWAMIWSFIESPPGCGEEDTRHELLRNFHYLHFAIFLFSLSAIISFVVSLVTRPLPKERLVGTTIWTLRSNEEIQRILDETEVPDMQALAKESEQKEGSGGRDWKTTLIHVFCGATEVEDQLDESVREAIELRMTATASRVNPKWQTLVDILSAAAVAIGLFMWGFFN